MDKPNLLFIMRRVNKEALSHNLYNLRLLFIEIAFIP